MYYKVIRKREVIDVLDKIVYVRYQIKHDLLLLSDESDAQGILSSDGKTAYHTNTLQEFPVEKFQTVTLEKITKTEYDRLKALNLKTPEQITEQVIRELIERGMF